MISEILIDEGYQVSTANGGQDANQQLQEISPDLVLLDIWMPDVDGISLLKTWKINPRKPRTPIGFLEMVAFYKWLH